MAVWRTLRILATCDIAAEGRGATSLNGAHHLQLRMAHMATVGITPSGPEVAEDIRDFQSGTLHECARLLRRLLLAPNDVKHIERAGNAAQYLGRDFGVARGRVQLRMAKRPRVILSTFLRH